MFTFLQQLFNSQKDLLKERKAKLLPEVLARLKMEYPGLHNKDYEYWMHRQAKSLARDNHWIPLKLGTGLDGRPILQANIPRVEKPFNPRRYRRYRARWRPSHDWEHHLAGGLYDQDFCD